MRNRRRRQVPTATVDIVTQLECAIRRPQATLIGALVGGLVPWFARTLAHEEVPSTWSSNHLLAIAMLAVVLGCAVFSAITVYKFGSATFGDKRKAIGFSVALEGVMLVSTGVTSIVALLALIIINALGSGAVIALAREATCKRREAGARRAATRRSRSRTTAEPRPAPQPAQRSHPVQVPVVVGQEIVLQPKFVDDAVDAEIVAEYSFL